MLLLDHILPNWLRMLHNCTSRTCGWFSCFILKKIPILCY